MAGWQGDKGPATNTRNPMKSTRIKGHSEENREQNPTFYK
jgi:hypothetical protein